MAADLTGALARCPLYFILDRSICGDNDPVAVGIAALAAGVTVLQLRLKGLMDSELATVARDLKQRWTSSAWILIVNDSVEAALSGGADGVHLGEEDMTIARARKLGPELIIGGTERYAGSALEAEQDGADYLGCGSVFRSSTKPGLPRIGVSGLAAIVSSVTIPVVGIGGINSTNARQILHAGAAGFCSIAQFTNQPDIGAAVRRFMAEFEASGEQVDAD